MSPVSFILELLQKLPPVLSATSRLVRAAKASEPPPVALDQGAEAYLRGANDEAYRQSQRERLKWIREELAKPEPPPEEEKPE